MELHDMIKVLVEKNEFEVHLTKDRKGGIEAFYYDSKGKKYPIKKDRDDMYDVNIKTGFYDQQGMFDNIIHAFEGSNKKRDRVSVLDEEPLKIGEYMPMLLKKYGYSGKVKSVYINDKDWTGHRVWDLGKNMFIWTGDEGESALMFRVEDEEIGNTYNKTLRYFNSVEEMPAVVKDIKKYYGKSDKVKKWD